MLISPQPFGVSYSGASYKYTVLDTSGHRSAAQGESRRAMITRIVLMWISVGQLSQTSYHSLQTPYSFFGLGRTNNYIENLFVGSTIHAKQHFINMEGVIPNSKVVILPSAKDGEAWKRQLFLRPGEWIPWVTLTVVVGTVLLAVIVFVLHLNEKVGRALLMLFHWLMKNFCRERMNWKGGGRHITLISMLYE